MSKKYKNYSITLLMADGKEHIIPFAVPMGEDGAKGDPGKSAYEIAVQYGFKGTEAEWLDSLKYGKDGESAYQIAVDYGFQGTETEWLASLKGEKGERGEQGLKGADGANGQNGADGKDGANGKDGVPATHSWNGTVLTVTSASGTSSANLKGEKGGKGDKGDRGEKGEQGIQGERGVQGEKGDKGDTPVKGVDYFTATDKQEIATEASKLVTKSSIGLGNVDNTSDANKPVSTAQRTAINDAYNEATSYTDKSVAEKQDVLVSGKNIKTINGQSVLGEGNIPIGGVQFTYVGDFVAQSHAIPSANGLVFAFIRDRDGGMGIEVLKYGLMFTSPTVGYSTGYYICSDAELFNFGEIEGTAGGDPTYYYRLEFDYMGNCTYNQFLGLTGTAQNVSYRLKVWKF